MQSDGCFFVLSNIDSECTISILQIGPQAVAGRSSISWYSGASKSCPTRRILCCGWNKRNPKTARIRVYDEQKLGRSSLQQGATDTRLENKIADSTWSSSGVGLSLFAVTRFTLMFFYNVAQIIYRDFKSSNVLLDENFHPKLSDFGLAREGPEFGRTHVSTAVMGTNGYAAPDYIKTGHLTAKSDVWSYGVVLYEILTGRRSLERHHPRPEQNLVEWVKYINPDSEKFSSIIDPRLENEYPINTARKVAKLANTCLEKNAKDRPSMAEVVNRLKQIIKAEDDDEPYEKSPDNSDNKPDMEREPEKAKVMDSWRRRMSHLQKLGEHVEGASRRRFMIMQRAKVP